MRRQFLARVQRRADLARLGLIFTLCREFAGALRALGQPGGIAEARAETVTATAT